ncbi:MAG TPA: helix-turn-helix domain-containing protein [Solirubrobacteraceae bacterium]|nr:helix-turn-helix domain-containing protein [Solirubrobacteraceae bacterium]
MLTNTRNHAPVATIESAPEPVYIELTKAQVDRVIRGASGSGTMSVLMAGLGGVRQTLEDSPQQIEDRRLSRSLLSGLLLLACFPTDGTYLSNTEVARRVDMNMSTAHRYISTLVSVGLLERDPGTRQYRLAQ